MNVERALIQIEKGMFASGDQPGVIEACDVERTSRPIRSVVAEMSKSDVSELIFDLPLYRQEDFPGELLISLYGFLRYFQKEDMSLELGFILIVLDLQPPAEGALGPGEGKPLVIDSLDLAVRMAVVAFFECISSVPEIDSDFILEKSDLDRILLQWRHSMY